VGEGGSPSTISAEYFDLVVDRDRRLDAEYTARRSLLKIRKLREPKEGDTLLDIGCSTGAITAAFGRLGLKATGVDVVPEFIAVARKNHPSMEFLVSPAEDLPFTEETFDLVVLLSVLEHVQDWRRSLREATRVLKDEGVLLVSTTNRIQPFQQEIRYLFGFGYLPSFLQRRIYSLAMKHRPAWVGYTHLPAYNWFTYRQLTRELRRLDMRPHRWLELLEEADIPKTYRRHPRLIMAALRSPIPLQSFLPLGTTIVALKASPRLLSSESARSSTK
jgi:ubiquinone/menaquinone biosynthesis C-methylase UbiE